MPHGYLSDDEGLNEDDESNTSAPPSPSRRKMSATTAATSTADGKGPRKKLEPLQHIIRGPKFVDDMETMVDAEFFTMRVRMLLCRSSAV